MRREGEDGREGNVQFIIVTGRCSRPDTVRGTLVERLAGMLLSVAYTDGNRLPSGGRRVRGERAGNERHGGIASACTARCGHGSVGPLGAVSIGAAVGDRARGLLPGRLGLDLLSARPRPLPRLSLG